MTQLSARQFLLLSSARVGHLATADPQGSPHVVPVCFAAGAEYIYSVLDEKPKRASLTRLRRVKNIQTNSQVTLLVDHYEEDWSRLWYIMVGGHGELLLTGEERIEAVDILRVKYRQYQTMDIDQNPVIKITPNKVVSWGVDSLGAGV